MKSFKLLTIAMISMVMSTMIVYADEHALFTTQSLTPEIALKAVSAAMAKCRDEGYQVSMVC